MKVTFNSPLIPVIAAVISVVVVVPKPHLALYFYSVQAIIVATFLWLWWTEK